MTAGLGDVAPPMLLINGTPIVASVDTWVRENNGQVYENDWVSVWHAESATDPGRRVGDVWNSIFRRSPGRSRMPSWHCTRSAPRMAPLQR